MLWKMGDGGEGLTRRRGGNGTHFFGRFGDVGWVGGEKEWVRVFRIGVKVGVAGEQGCLLDGRGVGCFVLQGGEVGRWAGRRERERERERKRGTVGARERKSCCSLEL